MAARVAIIPWPAIPALVPYDAADAGCDIGGSRRLLDLEGEKSGAGSLYSSTKSCSAECLLHQRKRYDPSIRRIKAPNNPPPTIPTMAPTLIPPTDEELEDVVLGAAEVVNAG
jgi:hypothetical protein